MPRHMRGLSRSKIYHVMVRANERKNIFLDEDDKTRYIDTLSKLTGHSLCGAETTKGQCSALHVKSEKKFYIHAYCLMDNHAHLLINEGEDEIARIMKRIGSSYAYYFNRKYGRVGHLFQDRFKSEAVEDDGYLLGVARYIHNNPVKAGIVKRASYYPWSSYNAYVDEGSFRSFIARDLILDIISIDRKKAVELFIEYTKQKNTDEFLDNMEANKEKTITGYKGANDFMHKYIEEKGISLSKLNEKENIVIRNELISQLKICSDLSIRELGKLLNLNRGVVQRLKP